MTTPKLDGEVLARPLGDDLAVVDEGDPVAELLGLLDVVGRQQDRRPLLVDPLDVVPELEPQLDVDAGGRLVEDQQPRPVHHRPRQDQPPLHPAGERPRPFVALLGQREGLEQFLGPLAPLALRHPEVAGVVVERLLDGQEPVDVRLLRGEADRLARGLVVVIASWPKVRIEPDVTWARPVVQWISVDFPAPFGPSRPKNSPGWI